MEEVCQEILLGPLGDGSFSDNKDFLVSALLFCLHPLFSIHIFQLFYDFFDEKVWW